VEIGYALSSEESGPRELVELARRAEEAGFPFALVSDHFHPWVDRQGQSPFVWSVIGGIAGATRSLRLGTGVTCPLIRLHPAIVAQAVATSAVMMEGRFFLGVGSGELLNEHVTGERWPFPDERREMLEEAIEVMRELWQGGFQTHRGRHYRVERARLYTLPEQPPEIYVAAGGAAAAELAGRAGDGLITTSPDEELVGAFRDAGGAGKPVVGQITVCFADDEDEALKTAHEWWPNVAIPLTDALATPEDYEAAAGTVRPEDVGEKIAYGPDPKRYLELLEKYAEGGVTHAYIHQIGPDQEGFFRFFERELRPNL